VNALGALEAELRLDVGGATERFAALRWIGFAELRRDGTLVFNRMDHARALDLLATGRALITAKLTGKQAIPEKVEAS
jgi:hypothetical protein